MSPSRALQDRLARIERFAFIAGAAALVLSAAGAFLDPDGFYRAWLVGWLFWLGMSLGSLGILMLQHVVGGAWGFATRRILEAAARVLPLVLVLFAPVVIGAGRLYPWAGPEAGADPLLGHKTLYLNLPFFIIRAIVYFAVWLALVFTLDRGSARLDREPDPALARHLRLVSAPGMVAYGITMTFAALDWGMSLEPHWFSTIYGVLIVVGQAVSAMALAIAAAALVREDPRASGVLTAGLFQDLGSLLLAFILFWAYVSFSQYLIIWSANLPEEIPWYLHRSRGGWEWIAAALAALHFALPFVLLLLRRVKRSVPALAALAIGVIALRYIDLAWIIQPAFHPGGPRPHWLDPTAAVAIGGLWLAVFLRGLRTRPIIPLHDARFEAAPSGLALPSSPTH